MLFKNLNNYRGVSDSQIFSNEDSEIKMYYFFSSYVVEGARRRAETNEKFHPKGFGWPLTAVGCL